MNNLRNCIVLVLLLLAVSVSAFDQKENFSPIERERTVLQDQVKPDNSHGKLALADPPYWQGDLKVYVVEHLSSMGWTSGGKAYEFPFLAFAIDLDNLILNDTMWDTTVTWDGYDYGYNNLREDNIAVQAVLFSQTDGYPAAAAMADPGVPGSNIAEPGNTHTVFVEEGTATW